MLNVGAAVEPSKAVHSEWLHDATCIHTLHWPHNSINVTLNLHSLHWTLRHHICNNIRHVVTHFCYSLIHVDTMRYNYNQLKY